MYLAILLTLTFQTSGFQGPVMIRCQLDTELPIEELRVSVTEKRELDVAIPSDAGVTLVALPEGDLHLSFFHNAERLGEIEVSSAKSGELIRLKVRLVSGNAILLDEYRIRGLNESKSSLPPLPSSALEDTNTVEHPRCPEPGETVTRTGKVTRIIDHDAFELQGDDRNLYTVYVGGATRFQEGSARLGYADLGQGLLVTVRGAVAAGPEGECSVGARQVLVQRR